MDALSYHDLSHFWRKGVSWVFDVSILNEPFSPEKGKVKLTAPRGLGQSHIAPEGQRQQTSTPSNSPAPPQTDLAPPSQHLEVSYTLIILAYFYPFIGAGCQAARNIFPGGEEDRIILEINVSGMNRIQLSSSWKG